MKKIFFCAAVCIATAACNNNSGPNGPKLSDSSNTAVKDTTGVSQSMDSAAMNKAWAVYMTPGEPHKMMAKSAGKWKEEVKFYMTPGAPPQIMNATCDNAMVLNGLYLVSTHKGMYDKQPFEGRSTMAYNNASKKYQSSWIDNMGSGIMNLEGTWDAPAKTVNMAGVQTDPMSGKEIAVRETMQFIDDNTQYMEMFETRDGKEVKTMEIRFARQ